MAKKPPPLDMFSRPDVATEVGFLAMFCANLEPWLIGALAQMLRIKVAEAFAMLRQIDNLSAKLGIVFEIAASRQGRPLPDAIMSSKSSVLAAVAKRNQLAHGGFAKPHAPNAPDNMILMLNVMSARRGKPKSVPLDLNELRAHSEALQAFIRTIQDHCGSMTYFLPGDPAPSAWLRMHIPANRPDK